MFRFKEYGLGVCELLETSESGALRATSVSDELGLSAGDYKNLLNYLKTERAILAAMPPNRGPLWGMQKGKAFHNWWERTKKDYLSLSFSAKRLARHMLNAEPGLRRVRRPWEGLDWDYQERYLAAASELIQEGLAKEDRLSDTEEQFCHLVLTPYGVKAVRSDFRRGAVELSPEALVIGKGAIQGEKPDFSFVTSSELRSIIERDYGEIPRCLASEAYKAAIVMCGSVMEALLLDRLLIDETEARQSPEAPKDKAGKVIKDLERWSLNSMIEVAQDLAIIAKPTRGMSHAVREYRNLIHPAVERRKKIAAEEEEARAARAALELIIKNLSGRGARP